MQYFSGRTETIQMEKLITHEPETYMKTVRYNFDGSIASTTVIDWTLRLGLVSDLNITP